jgi:hypothetical protein
MVPAWAVDTGFFLGFVVGLGVVVWTLLRPPINDSGSGKLKISGWEFQFNGRSIFQLSVGILLIAFPVLLSAASRPSSTTPVARSFQQVDTIPDPSYTAFRFVRDTTMLDLHNTAKDSVMSRLPIVGEKSNPVNLTNTMRVRKVSASSVISFTYATSGMLDIRCLTQQCKLKRASQKDVHSGGELKETWEVTADVSDIPVGEEFEVVIEATYWNAFDAPQKQWYASYANDQTEPETLATLVLFPTSKPFSEYSTLAYPHGSTQAQLFGGVSKIVPSSDKLSIYWEIPNAQGDKTYEIHWKL